MVGHSIVAVAFVGKSNEPLYFFTEEDTAEALNLQMIIYGSLDVVDEKRQKPSNTSPNADPLYLGSLYAVDEYKVYGHYSNTHTKTIIVCDNTLQESIVKNAILELTGHFITAIQNPFQAIGQPIVSRKFTELVQKVISKHQAAPVIPNQPRKP